MKVYSSDAVTKQHLIDLGAQQVEEHRKLRSLIYISFAVNLAITAAVTAIFHLV